ncbi:MAG TPA: ATP-dependent DNA helicase [Methanofastidiosum sp.]|nr:ATP-dependent DNA helicase [Methanofastidiosum sp.]
MADILTPPQVECVEHVDSPLLIIAGPGSGKTRVLTNKAVYLMDKLNFKPKEILMTTFTVKAAEEMRHRIEYMSDKDTSGMFIGTIHSFCENLIKEKGGEDLYTDFEILDDFKKYLFLKKNLNNLGLNLDELKKLKRVMHYNELIVLLIEFYDTITENLIDREKLKFSIFQMDNTNILGRIIDYNLKKKELIEFDEIKKIITSLIDSYDQYISLLNENKLLDFALLESIAWKIISEKKDVLEELKSAYKYIMVDEFQDINPLQWKIISSFINNNITCVGDKNQSIYGFRGSNPNIFDYFQKQFTNSVTKDLSVNFRSRKEIVSLSKLFLHKRHRRTIDLKPNREEGCKICYLVGETEEEATRNILNFVKLLKDYKKIDSYGDVAILFRSLKYHGKDFLRLLNDESKDIPFVLYGGSSFLDNHEIRSILYLLAYVYSIEDTREIQSVTDFNSFCDLFDYNLLKLENNRESYRELNWPIFSNPNDLVNRGIDEFEASIIVKINELREKISENQDYSIQSAFYELVGILDIMRFEEEGNIKIIHNLGKFSEMLEDFFAIYSANNLLMFIRILDALPENINLNKKNNSVEVIDNNSLNLMNIHQAKGLEFPVIIIPSLTKQRFPKNKQRKLLLDIPREFFLYEPYDPLMEEENLFFVAMTRAEDFLLLSYFTHHNDSGRSTKSSEYIEDIFGELNNLEYVDMDEIDISNHKESELDVKLINYSAISTYIDCPQRFRINYLYGFKAEAIFQQKVGLIYHNAIAKVNRKLKNTKIISDEDIDCYIDGSWIDIGSQNDLFRHKIKKGLKKYVDYMSENMNEILAVEKPLSMSVESIRVKGRADLLYENINGEIILIDFKARKLEAILDTHVDYQLKFYSDALKNDGHEIHKCIAYPLEEDYFNYDNVEIDIKDNKEIYGLLNDFASCMKEKNFRGTKNDKAFCKKCPYHPMCNHYKVF